MPQIHCFYVREMQRSFVPAHGGTRRWDGGWFIFVRARVSITKDHPGVILNPGRIDRKYHL